MKRFLGVALLATVAIVGCKREAASVAPTTKPAEAPTAEAAPAPDASAVAQTDGVADDTADDVGDTPTLRIGLLDGGDYYLASRRGRWVLLNFCATWCKPCVKELPELQRLQEAYGNGEYRVVAVSVNTQKEMGELIKFIKKLDVESIAGYHDYEGQLQKSLKIKELPVTYIINRRGQILYRISGEARWTNPEIRNFLNLVLAMR